MCFLCLIQVKFLWDTPVEGNKPTHLDTVKLRVKGSGVLFAGFEIALAIGLGPSLNKFEPKVEIEQA